MTTETNNLPLFRRVVGYYEVVEPLTDDQIRNWITQLRSGNFAQATGQLVVSEEDQARDHVSGCGHCCLGVLAETENLFGKYDFKRSSGDLAVYTDSNGKLAPKTRYAGLDQQIAERLAELNDSYGYTFDKIADVIETGYFTEFEGTNIPDTLIAAGFDREWADYADIKEFQEYDEFEEF